MSRSRRLRLPNHFPASPPIIMDITSILLFLPFFVACAIAALMGALFPAQRWYRSLKRPGWSPPAWLFGPVWTLLYILIAIAGWRLALFWPAPAALAALVAWGVQIVLNAVWTPLFFGLRRPDLAFYEITILWLAIAATILLAAPVDGLAALLMLPYLAWAGFAAALNFSIWRLNGSRPQA